MKHVAETVIFASDSTFSFFVDEMRNIGWPSNVRRVRAIEEILMAIEEGSGVAFIVESSEHNCEDGYRVLRCAKRHATAVLQPTVLLIGDHAAHAIRAFELEAFDYLLAPLERMMVHKSLSRLKDNIMNDHFEAFNLKLQRVLDTMMSSERQRRDDRSRAFPRPVERIGVRVGDRWIVLKVNDIQCVTGAGVYVRICAGGESYLLRTTMSEIEIKLDPLRFLRIHRSTIVNMEMVREVRNQGNGAYIVVLNDGTRLRVSRGYGEKVREFMDTVG
jgi:two-component system, LytTR family, response regulator